MTALAASQSIRERSAAGQSFVVKDAETTYAGGQAALAAGYLVPYSGAAGESPIGRLIGQGSVLGDTSATPQPTHDVALEGYILEAVPVAGASTIASVGSVVFLNDTDNPKADLTLTRPTRGIAFGRIVKFRSASEFDVRAYGMAELDALQGVGRREIIELGTFANVALADGDIVTGFKLPYRAKIISLHGQVLTAFTGSGGTATVNLEIAGTNVTGGTLVVSTAAGGTIGLILDAAAITAANVLSEGVALDVEVASAGGTQTAGSVRLYMVVERLPGV